MACAHQKSDFYGLRCAFACGETQSPPAMIEFFDAEIQFHGTASEFFGAHTRFAGARIECPAGVTGFARARCASAAAPPLSPK